MCAGLCQLCPCLQPLPIAMHVLNCVLTAACLCPRMWGNASQTLCPVCVCVSASCLGQTLASARVPAGVVVSAIFAAIVSVVVVRRRKNRRHAQVRRHTRPLWCVSQDCSHVWRFYL